MRNKFLLIQDYISYLSESRFYAKRRFLFFLLFVFGSLIFLIYPQVSLAASPAVTSGDSVILGLSVEETAATASGTVTAIGDDATAGGVGFVWGIAAGNYTATSSKFDTTGSEYATSTDFSWSITTGGAVNSSTTLSEGTLYYYAAYTTSTVGDPAVVTHGYGAEKTLLTKPAEPTSLIRASKTQTSLNLSWTVGQGAQEYMVRYSNSYPASISAGNQGCLASSATCNITGLVCGSTYYLRAWASTTWGGYGQQSDTYAQLDTGTDACATTGGGGKSFTAPTTYNNSLVIAQGAASAPAREVALALRASNVSYMSISNDQLFLGPLEDYATTKTWTLTEGDGLKTVYVKFVSPDGMNSDVVSDAITLKTAVVAASAPTPAPTPTTPIEEVPAPAPVPAPTTPTPAAEEKPISEMTVDEIQVKIAEIMAQIKGLQEQLVEVKVAEKITGCTITSFNRNLKQGMSGSDVKCLQIILNSSADTKIAASGVGSAGNETTYFGALTKEAVIKFQKKYASEILAPWGFTDGTGLVFTTTRAKLNELLGE